MKHYLKLWHGVTSWAGVNDGDPPIGGKASVGHVGPLQKNGRHLAKYRIIVIGYESLQMSKVTNERIEINTNDNKFHNIATDET